MKNIFLPYKFILLEILKLLLQIFVAIKLCGHGNLSNLQRNMSVSFNNVCQLCPEQPHTHTHTHIHRRSKWMKNEFNCPMLSVNIFEMGSHMDQTKDHGQPHWQNKKRAGEQHFGNIFMTATAVKLWPLSAQFTCLGGGLGWPTSEPKSCIRMSRAREPPPVLWIELLLHSVGSVGYSHCLSVGIKANFAHFACLTRLSVDKSLSSLSALGFWIWGWDSVFGMQHSAFSFQPSAIRLGLRCSVLACCLWQQQQQPQRAT